jgi:hypothetical protein
MTTLTLTLGAPSHAVEPALLAQRLPTLARALRFFAAAPGRRAPAPSPVGKVHVHAALLGVQRDHITLEALPLIVAAQRQSLAALAASLAGDFSAEGLVWTGASVIEPSSLLGVLNLELALPPAANFIGRDIAKALPRGDDARVLRQFVNAAQMTLHQSPMAGAAVNSLWCSNVLPSDVLSQTWLQNGLSAWWDALPAWDAALDLSDLPFASQLDWVFSDQTVSVPLKRRAAWAPWIKPLDLSALLQTHDV